MARSPGLCARAVNQAERLMLGKHSATGRFFHIAKLLEVARVLVCRTMGVGSPLNSTVRWSGLSSSVVRCDHSRPGKAIPNSRCRGLRWDSVVETAAQSRIRMQLVACLIYALLVWMCTPTPSRWRWPRRTVKSDQPPHLPLVLSAALPPRAWPGLLRKYMQPGST